jgi:hypothetical protein
LMHWKMETAKSIVIRVITQATTWRPVKEWTQKRPFTIYASGVMRKFGMNKELNCLFFVESAT